MTETARHDIPHFCMGPYVGRYVCVCTCERCVKYDPVFGYRFICDDTDRWYSK